MSDAKPAAPANAAPAAPAGGGGIKALLPLILTVVLMPVLAFVMTTFVIVPKLQKATVQAREDGHGTEEGGDAHAEEADDHAAEDTHAKKEEGAKKDAGGHGGGGGGAHGKKEGGHGKSSSGKPTVQFGKVLVNVAGSQGSRYLLTNFTLVGANSDFQDKIEASKDQLMDASIGALRTKTIQDLEKPGAANLIRTELITVFNNILGSGAVKEIYFTEFAIQ